MESQLALVSIAAVTVLSGGAAAIITLTVDVVAGLGYRAWSKVDAYRYTWRGGACCADAWGSQIWV
jgi:hypothetical protein